MGLKTNGRLMSENINNGGRTNHFVKEMNFHLYR